MSAILAHHWTSFWVNVCWGGVSTDKLSSFSAPMINIHNLSVRLMPNMAMQPPRDHYVCRTDNRDCLPKSLKEMWNQVKKLYSIQDYYICSTNPRGEGLLWTMKEMCLSTGLRNGVTSHFVPNLGSDQDNKVGPMPQPQKWYTTL